MHPRIGFRRLLPILNVVLYGMFLCGGIEWRSTLSPANHAQPADDSQNPARLKAVISLNAPAILLALFLNSIVFPLHPARAFVLSVLFIPVLWYLVGRWIDQHLGWIHRPMPKRSFLRDALLIAGGVLAFLAIVVAIQVIRAGYPGPPDPLGIGLGFCIWFGFLLFVIARMLYFRFARRSALLT